MGTGLLLLLLLAAGVGLYVLQRRRQARCRLRPRTTTLFSLELGDLVQFDGRDWVVENRLVYEEDGFRWLEYLLCDGPDRGWLSVEEDDWLELGWYRPVPMPADFPRFRPGVALPPSLRWEGQDYSLREHGRAQLTASLRAMPQQASEVCRYGDYEAADGSLLALELWQRGGGRSGPRTDPEAELAVGRRIEPALLSLLPGDGRSVYRPEVAGLPSG